MERRAGHGRQSPRSVWAEGSLLEGRSLRGEEVVQAGVGGSVPARRVSPQEGWLQWRAVHGERNTEGNVDTGRQVSHYQEGT